MRISRDDWAMEMAIITAKRSTCLRRSVGCVLLNKRGHVISTGYNGVAAGQPHCNDLVPKAIHSSDPRVKVDRNSNSWVFKGKLTPIFNDKTIASELSQCVGFDDAYPYACSGAESLSGTNLDGCEAIHAEQNALLQCPDVYEIDTAYVTASPCMTCTKLLLNTNCRRIVFLEEYPHVSARALWENAGREWIKYCK